MWTEAIWQVQNTGHRSQVQITAVLINNWVKQFPVKLKFYFALWLGLGDTYKVLFIYHSTVTWAQLFERRLALNPGFFFLCLKAFSRLLFCAIFRATNHQLLDKKELKVNNNNNKCYLARVISSAWNAAINEGPWKKKYIYI